MEEQKHTSESIEHNMSKDSIDALGKSPCFGNAFNTMEEVVNTSSELIVINPIDFKVESGPLDDSCSYAGLLKPSQQ